MRRHAIENLDINFNKGTSTRESDYNCQNVMSQFLNSDSPAMMISTNIHTGMNAKTQRKSVDIRKFDIKPTAVSDETSMYMAAVTLTAQGIAD